MAVWIRSGFGKSRKILADISGGKILWTILGKMGCVNEIMQSLIQCFLLDG